MKGLIVAALLGGAPAAAGGTSTRPLPSLEPVIVFANPAGCEFGEPLARIFDGLAAWNDATGRNEAGAPFRVPGLPQLIVPRLARQADGYVRAYADLRGRWHGLNVTGVETVFLPESDDFVLRILFAAPRGRLIEVLNAQGFGLDPRTGETAVGDASVEPASSMFVSVEPRGRRMALSCAAG